MAALRKLDEINDMINGRHGQELMKYVTFDTVAHCREEFIDIFYQDIKRIYDVVVKRHEASILYDEAAEIIKSILPLIRYEYFSPFERSKINHLIGRFNKAYSLADIPNMTTARDGLLRVMGRII